MKDSEKIIHNLFILVWISYIMTSLSKKTKSLSSLFMRRKHRVNSIIKKQWFSFRLVVSRSNMYTYAQVIDPKGHILLWISDKALGWVNKVTRAFELWKKVAEHCNNVWIWSVTFDRNGHLYHGRVKALAEWAREWGLKI